MTLCDFCTQQFFHFSTWYRNTTRSHHDSAQLWAVGIRSCSLCLALIEAIKEALVDTVGNASTELDSLFNLGLVHSLPLPIYEAVLYESAARDQWELDFRPKQKSISFTTALREVDIELPTRTFKVYGKYYHSVRPTPRAVDVRAKFEEFQRNQKALQQGLTLGKDAQVDNSTLVPVEGKADEDFIVRLPAENTNSRDAFGQFRTWLRNCDEHEQCRKLRDQTEFMPSRLLDVGTSGDVIRLVDTRSEDPTKRNPEHYRYATLSHCWGGFVSPTLSRKNLPKMLDSIPLVSLPLSFRDAIQTTRELGIGYIWIDSLCIIQDSDEDKRDQIPDMHAIYGTSYLNLAATSSRNSHQGFFRNRQLSLLLSEVDVEGVPCVIVRKDFWSGELLTEPLYKRAWTLQERTLSPRTLHFSRQVFWQCLDTTACETMPRGVPLVIDSGREELKWRRLLHQEVFSRQDEVNLQGVWQRLVQTYKQCAITVETDTLPALGGLVTKMQKITGEEYVAGLWRSQLIEQLAWRVSKPNRRYASYCAPSWAWASMDAPVVLPPRVVREKDDELRLIELYCYWKADKPSEIEEAWLEVEGDVFQSREVNIFHPDAEGAVPEAIIPLFYEKTSGSVTGWALAVQAVVGELPLKRAHAKAKLGRFDSVYRRVGLIEWRTLREDGWKDITQGKSWKRIMLL